MDTETDSDSESAVDAEEEVNPSDEFVAPDEHSVSHPPMTPSMEAIANHPPIYHTVPYRSRSHFTYRCSIPLDQYTAASAQHDTVGILGALTKFLSTPQQILTKPTPTQRLHSPPAAQHQQTELEDDRNSEQDEEWREHKYDDGNDECIQAEIDGVDERIQMNDTREEEEESRIINKSTALIRSKHIGRAAKTLSRPKSSHLYHKMQLQQLLAHFKPLHPQPPSDRPLTPMPDHSYRITINLDDPPHREIVSRDNSTHGKWIGSWIIGMDGRHV
jgi:hypothetical protein